MILNGSKTHGCQGLIPFEMVRQNKERNQVDLEALAADIKLFKSWFRDTKGDFELRDCEKWMERWREWRAINRGSSWKDWPENQSRFVEKTNVYMMRQGDILMYRHRRTGEFRPWTGQEEA